MSIEKCRKVDFEAIHQIINDSANAYKGVIPEDRWKEPYISRQELSHEINDGVVFYAYWENQELIAVMGMQDVKDVTLIRHAYVKTERRNQGIGTKLLLYLKPLSKKPILVGTWKDAVWAIKFYVANGFELAPEKAKLLRKYWRIPERQIEESVVLREVHRKL